MFRKHSWKDQKIFRKNVLKTSLGREVKTCSETVARNLAMKQAWNFALETSLESSVITIFETSFETSQKIARKLATQEPTEAQKQAWTFCRKIHQIGNKLENQLGNKMENQLGKKLENQIGHKLTVETSLETSYVTCWEVFKKLPIKKHTFCLGFDFGFPSIQVPNSMGA